MTFPRAAALGSAFVSTLVLLSAQQPSPRAPEHARIPEQVLERLARDGRVRVIAELKVSTGDHVPEGRLAAQVALQQRAAIRDAAVRAIAAARLRSTSVIRRYRSVPYLTLDVGHDELQALQSSPDVVRVLSDDIVRPVLAESVPLIQADQAWQSGYDGAGTVIAVVDTGVDAYHPFLTGKVVEEACYSSTVAGTSNTVCPNGLDEQIGPGAAAPCALPDCIHGTHVAGIAAGSGATGGQPFSGVAKSAQLMAVQVASTVIDSESCGGAPPCSGAFTSDIIAALEHVYDTAASRNIVAVNLSLGGGSFTQPCSDSPYKPAIDNLRSIGVVSIIASGNSGSPWSLASPACVPSAVSVGSVSKGDGVSWFSDVSSFLSLLAPGESINSSVPGAGFSVLSGTSMAAPHVSGGWALIRQAAPAADVADILDALRTTGHAITDNRFFGSATVPRVNVFEALATLAPTTNPAPSVSALSPASVRAGLGPVSVTVSGSGFNAFSVGRWNGQPRTTTAASTTQLRVTLSAADIPTVGTGEISVVNPAPGGGTSSALTLSIDPPPVLTSSASLVGAGTTVTVTLANGFGDAGDWLSFATSGSPVSSYIHWTYVGTGVTSRTWSVVTPSTSGTYEFRLIQANGRRAASAPLTVDATLNPTPVVGSLSPATAFSNSGPFTLTVTGTGFTAASIVKWNGANRATTFVGSTQLRAAILAGDVAAVGTAAVTVSTPPPGGGTTASLPFSIVQGPVLTANASIVAAGATVTSTLTGGLGGSADWLALAQASSPNDSYVQWTYVGTGLTSRTWTVSMPTTAGAYEFRLFVGSVRAATSPTITVDTSLSPLPVIASLSPSSAFTGSGPFTLTVSGSGFTASSVVRWNGTDRATTFINGTQLQAAVLGSDVAAAGTAVITVASPPPGGGVTAAVPFTVVTGPTLAVNATLVAPGMDAMVTLTNGLGGSGDWLALAATTAPNGSYLQWTYVGAGLTTRTWAVKMPSTPGTYEFRLFTAGSKRAATSPPVSVDSSLSPPPVVSSLSPVSAYTGSGALTLTVNGAGFTTASVVRWNGSNRTTTFVSSSQLQAAITPADVSSAATVQVSAFNPPPGGGTSASIPFTVAVGPALSVDATLVAAGANVTVTLTNGLGGSGDWLALAPVAAPNNNYLLWTYVGAGVSTRTWTVKMPTTSGAYEFRLFVSGSVRAATSAAITVDGSLNPAPAISSLSPSTAFAGSGAVILTVNGSGFTSASVVRWNGAARATTFVSSTQLRAAIADADVASIGTAEVTVFSPSPGGGTTAGLPFTIVNGPKLTVTATSAAPGASVTVTLKDGAGGSGNWLALAATSAPNTSYLQWTYVGTGVTTRTWSVIMPATPGTYEFRYFLSGYTRAATSATITVGN